MIEAGIEFGFGMSLGVTSFGVLLRWSYFLVEDILEKIEDIKHNFKYKKYSWQK